MFLDKVKLMNYSKSEELINSLSHGIGVIFAFFVLILCSFRASRTSSVFMLISAFVFGISMLLLYLSSAVYHAVPKSRLKRALRVIDHAMIYFLIAGTATPFALVSVYNLNRPLGWLIFAIAWGGCIFGVVLTVFAFEKTKLLQIGLYLSLGWIMLFAALPILPLFPSKGLRLLLLGGLFYIIGSVFLGLGRKIRYMHSLFHFFVLAGSATHFACIFDHVLS